MTKRGRPNVRQSIGGARQFMRWTLAGVLCLCGGGTAFATPASFTFSPPNGGWVPARLGGEPLSDPEGDTAGPRDIVGDEDNPMLYVAADSTHLYFRLRVDEDPLRNASDFRPFGWGCFINTDSDPTTYEFSTIIDGVNNPDLITFFKNTTTTVSNSSLDAPDLPPVSVVSDPLDAGVVHAQVVEATSTFNGDADYFIEWAIERSATDAAGFDTSGPTLYYCGSSNNGSVIAADCSGSADDECPLDSQFSDPVSCGVNGCGVCGDDAVDGSEGCDDGGLVGGDGCSALCLIELGQPCTASPACESGFCDPDSDTCECDADADCPVGELCSTALTPNSCVGPGCGNAILESGEGCDDGNVAPDDGCDAACLRELGEDCSLAAECASGFCDPFDSTCACDAADDCPSGELCDTGADPNACVASGCGNNVLESGEACDDGNTSAGDGCDEQCLLELGQPCDEPEDCQSEFCSSSDLCACDDNDDCADGQDCSGQNVCVSPTCGDNSVDLGEGCDDGNTSDGDGCNAQCLLELGEPCTDSADCASAFCDPDADSCACDQSVDCPAGQLCETSAAPNQCVDPGCGNNVLESGEGCDDGNTTAADGCSAACLLELGEPCVDASECESGLCDSANSTCSCDDASDCATGQLCDLASDPNACVDPGCGNGVLETGEACDDGNMMASDGCNAACLLELDEPCSDGNECASDACDDTDSVCVCDDTSDCLLNEVCDTESEPPACVPAGCGNGVLEVGEGCDDANIDNGDGCTTQCLIELGEPCSDSSGCASGLCDPDADVCACDDDDDCPLAQTCNSDPDPNVCVAPGCGNGLIEIGESCDDSNTVAGDGCDESCRLELGEECDEGTDCASGACDGVDNVCTCNQDNDCEEGEVCNETPSPNECVEPGCGDGRVEAPEGCDDGNGISGDGCNAECLIELDEPCDDSTSCASGLCDPDADVCMCADDDDCPGEQICNTAPEHHVCVALGCGNGVLEPGEGCDDANSEDFDGCTAQCLLELGEACEDSADCASGLCDVETGVCTCADDDDCPLTQVCDTAPDPNVCLAPGCGNNQVEAGESCDDGNTTPGDGCSSTCLLELDQPCEDSSDCASGSCDGVDEVCACNQDNDCDEGEICNETPNPNECVEAGCGDGRVEAPEACDDGNDISGDGCNAECLLELDEPCDDSTTCASGLCDFDAEVCMCADDDDCPEGQICDTAPEHHVCVALGCGNSVVEAGESCDDGNTATGDGCDAACLLELGEPCSDNDECASDLCTCEDDAEGDEESDGCSTVCAEPDSECSVDSECADRQICDAGECVTVECTQDSHCGTGENCELSSHTCGECSSDSECGPDFVCDTAARACRNRVYASGGGIVCSIGRAPGEPEPLAPDPALVLTGLGLVSGWLRRRLAQSRAPTS